jgi:predicted esterase
LCYSDTFKGKINYPIDLNSGVIRAEEFASWKKKDPVEFLAANIKNLADVTLYLDVGRFDEFSLQYGARRIHELLRKHKIGHQYSEFDGGHFKTTPRKIEALKWLKRIWK